MSGPSATPTPAVAAQIPIAFARSRPGKMLVMMDKVAGMISALPIPMNARLAMSWFAEPDKADSREPVPKIKKPAWRAGRRPYLSPTLPMVRSRPAKTSV